MKSGVIINGLLINYYLFNKEGLPKLILLHGWRSSGAIWQKIAQKFAAAGFAVYCPDLPGFGESDPPDEAFSISDYKDIVSAFITKMNLKDSVIVGHSFGGRIAIKLLSGDPRAAKKLVLVDSAGFLSKRNKKVWAFWAKIVRPIFSPKFMRGVRRLIYKTIGAEDYVATPELRDTFVNVVNEDLGGYLKNISQPTLVIWGDGDKDTPVEFAKRMKDAIPDSEIKIIKGAGHFSFLDDPEEFSKTVIEFLKG